MYECVWYALDPETTLHERVEVAPQGRCMRAVYPCPPSVDMGRYAMLYPALIMCAAGPRALIPAVVTQLTCSHKLTECIFLWSLCDFSPPLRVRSWAIGKALRRITS